MKIAMGQAGGSKTLHLTTGGVDCVFWEPSQEQEDVHHEVPLGEHLKAEMGSGMKPEMSPISISGVNVKMGM